MNRIPGDIQQHIKDLTKASGLDESEESVEKMARAWIEKMDCFEETIRDQNMEEIDFFEKNDKRGAIVLTYSGSILNVGPVVDDRRHVEYASIGIRTDVPENAVSDDSRLSSDILIGEAAAFESGPVKTTSSVHKIAVCNENMSIEEQEETLSNTTVMLSDDFIKINQTIIAD